jgi:hypothetical protein
MVGRFNQVLATIHSGKWLEQTTILYEWYLPLAEIISYSLFRPFRAATRAVRLRLGVLYA